jgi:hypothetical protein
LIFLYACQTRYIVNDEGGVRPRKEYMFRNNSKNFVLQNNLLLDTNCIYLRKGAIIESRTDTLPTVYYRFWANGRVQGIWPKKNQELNSIVNNTEIGYIGYYQIKKGRLIIEMIEESNGGQTSTRFGLFENGDIYFYEQSPHTYFSSWKLLKCFEGKNKTRWTKTSVDSLKFIKPTW